MQKIELQTPPCAQAAGAPSAGVPSKRAAPSNAPWNKRPRTVLVPVRCPECGKSTSMRSAWVVVDTVLTRWNRMKLKAACCRVSWNASPAELDAIRRHVGPNVTRANGSD